MATQIETVRYIQHAEENRLSPGNLLVANTHPERSVAVIEMERGQIDHEIVAAHFQTRAAVTAKIRLELVHVAEIIVDARIVVGAQLHRTGQVLGERGLHIQLAARRHQVPVIRLAVVGSGDVDRDPEDIVEHIVWRGFAVVDINLLVERILVIGELVGHLLAYEARYVEIERQRRRRCRGDGCQRDTADCGCESG